MKLGKPPTPKVSQDGTFPIQEMVHGETYMTAQSPEPFKHLPVRLVQADYAKRKVLVKAWYPMTREWQEVWVEFGYKVRNPKGEEIMKIKKSVAAPATNGTEKSKGVKKTVGKTTGVGIFDTWYIAFQKHGKDPKAVVSFLKAEYPGRATNWEKWVNGMRQRYNRGLLGTKPTTPLESYKKAVVAPKAK